MAATATAPNWRGHAVGFRPHPGPQTRFLALACFEVLYGGAAGGGKSLGGVIGALRRVGRGFGRNYKALLLRREFPEIESTLLPEMEKYYPLLGGRYRSQKKYWVFPEGERIYLGHAQHAEDIKRYLGTEWQYLFFDELTTFERTQYIYAISRLRSSHGIPVFVRSGTNPGQGSGHEWVFERWAPWLNPEHPIQAAPEQILYFVRDADAVEHCVPRGTRDYEGNLALGRTFIPALSTDNPSLSPSYRRILDELDPVTRAQLKHGNWLIKPGRGLYYKRPWLSVVDAAPARAIRVRYWDKAATQDGGDWTVGVRLAMPTDREFRGLYFIEDVKRERGSPRVVENLVMATAREDGLDVTIGVPEDPGQAGKFEADYYLRELGSKGYTVRARRETGDKISRQNPVSAQAEAGNLKVVRGPWNKVFLDELEAFPEGAHDDDVDSLSGAFAMLTRDLQEYTPPKQPGGAPSIGQNMGGY